MYTEIFLTFSMFRRIWNLIIGENLLNYKKFIIIYKIRVIGLKEFIIFANLDNFEQQTIKFKTIYITVFKKYNCYTI